MLSPADLIVVGALALIFFGPDQFPKVARRAGQAVRDLQNTSRSFIAEMEHAADLQDAPPPSLYEPPAYEEEHGLSIFDPPRASEQGMEGAHPIPADHGPVSLADGDTPPGHAEPSPARVSVEHRSITTEIERAFGDALTADPPASGATPPAKPEGGGQTL